MKKQIINYQDKWKEIKLKVEDLVLDTKNVRLGIEHNTQDEIINDLFVNEDAMSILENIIQNGYYPDEPPVVIKDKSNFVVLEGNRRVVSLKAMISPGIAPTKYSTKIAKLMENYSPIEVIHVHVANSRDEAMEYLASKHTKTTRKPWTALRRAYFYYAQKEQGQTLEKLIERYKGVNIPNYIKMYEMHNVALSLKNISEETRKKVSNTGNFNISTLERFVDDKYVREKIGINFNKKTGEATVPSSDDFDKVYSQVVTDIVAGIATSRKELVTEDSRKKYIDSVTKQVLNGKDLKLGTKKPASSFKPVKTKLKEKDVLIQPSLVDTFGTPGITRRLWELEYIDFRKFPNATADMIRTVLEIVLKDYLDKISKTPAPKRGKYIYLDDVLDAMKQEFVAIKNNRLSQVIDTIKTDKWFLESINHNPDVFADGDRVKVIMDLIHPIMKFVFEDYKKRNP